MHNWPRYACAILEDDQGRLLVESRPADARLAAGQLTCFGGRRESDESPEQCLRRELREELSWEPQSIEKRVELWVGGEPIAWFYEARLNVPFDRLQPAFGIQPLMVPRDALPALPVSPWHQAVLRAWCDGLPIVKLDP